MTHIPLAVLWAAGAAAAAAAWFAPPAARPPWWTGAQATALVVLIAALVTLLRDAMHRLRDVAPDEPAGVEPHPPRRWFGATRAAIYALIVACIVQVARFPRFDLATWLGLVGLAEGLAAAGWFAFARKRPARPGPDTPEHREAEPPTPPARPRTALRTGLRALEWIVGTGLFLVVGAELGLRLVAWFAPAPILLQRDTGIEKRVAVMRLTPGVPRFGFPTNAHGYPDAPFEARAGTRHVLVIGDESGVGVVPAPLHYTAVAEAQLDATELWNIGVAGIGSAGYRYLLETEGLALGPDAVVVAVDLADDLIDAAPRGYASKLESEFAFWLDRENVLVCLLAERVGTLLDERERLGRPPGVPGERSAGSQDPSVAGLAARFLWTADPSLEEPAWSRELWLATVRAQVHGNHGPGADAAIDRVVDDLVAIARRCADAGIPVAVLLIPAEYQVDDELWRTVADAAPPGALRDAPQARIAERLSRATRGILTIRVLDLLPVLRAAAPWTDGRPHLWHRHADRFNARGHRIAGETLAAFLRGELR